MRYLATYSKTHLGTSNCGMTVKCNTFHFCVPVSNFGGGEVVLRRSRLQMGP